MMEKRKSVRYEHCVIEAEAKKLRALGHDDAHILIVEEDGLMHARPSGELLTPQLQEPTDAKA